MTNLLFVFSDQHAAHVAGCYDDAVVETPAIDRIAREGARFDAAYCPSPICVPSRMAMLTARHPHRQECWANDDVLRSDLPTWAHMAGAAGLHPILFGRMHAMGLDQLHGYVERPIGDHSPNWAGKPTPDMGVLRGTNGPDAVSLERSGPGRSIYQVKDREVTDAALAWLRGAALERRARGLPFCATVGYMMPHAPYVVDDAAYARYAGRVPPPRLPRPPSDEHGYHRWWRESRGGISDDPATIDRARTAYWALVHRMDEMIGELLDALEETGQLDDTLVVYASDHGDHVGERGLWWKHTFFEESVRVPLVMRLPGTVASGTVVTDNVSLIDLSQTMLDVLGAEPIPDADGRSFRALLGGDGAGGDGDGDGNRDRDGADRAHVERAPRENVVFSEYCTDPAPAWTAGRAVQQRMVREGDWKLAIYDSDPPQLFDLGDDPDELRDRAADPACRDVYERLFARASEGWSAEGVRAIMAVRARQKAAIADWVRVTDPPDTHRWPFAPGDNALSETDADRGA